MFVFLFSLKAHGRRFGGKIGVFFGKERVHCWSGDQERTAAGNRRGDANERSG